MRRSQFVILSVLLLLLPPAMSMSGSSQDSTIPSWNDNWAYQEELQIPISTTDPSAKYQPIDLRITFHNPCWTENETKTSIRVCCWYKEEWYLLETQIYNIKRTVKEVSYIQECNIVFLIPSFADGTERYFLYYNGVETPPTSFKNHVNVIDSNYTSSPIPELTAQAKFYGIIEDGYCIYAVGQQGNLLDRSISQVIIKQQKDSNKFDLLGSDQIVSFAFSYYYGSKEKDESSSDQVFVDKKILYDGNLMVEFGIISESKMKDIQTTVLYRYYYDPLDEKKIDVHVKHEMLKDATVQGIENLDGRYGAIISLKSRSATVESLNFGDIYPYLDFYGENGNIKEYQMDQNPATKDREWIITYKDDADLGSEAWLSYGDGKEGKASAVLFASNVGLVQSGTNEEDGIQLKVAEKQYLNFLGTEVDYAIINFGRNSYEPGHSHDVLIPSDLNVSFDAEVFASENGGYTAVQEESHLYQTLAKSRQLSSESPFERELKRYNVTIATRLGGTHFSYPRLSNRTGRNFPVMWIELNQNGHLVAEGAANRSLIMRASKTFTGIVEGEYLVKVYWKRGNTTKIFTGAEMLPVYKDTKVIISCTWERIIKFVFLDQHGRGIPGIHGRLLNNANILFDENTSGLNGEICVKAPYNPNDPYTFEAEYKDFIIYDKELQKTLKKLNVSVNLEIYNVTVKITDALNFPPGADLTPLLITSMDDQTIELSPDGYENGLFFFQGVPIGEYTLEVSYGDFTDKMYVKVPNSNNIIQMKFTAVYHLVLKLFDSKGNSVNDNDIDFKVIRDGQFILDTKERTITLPPGQYHIEAYTKNSLIGEKDVDLTNDRQLVFVTTLQSTLPLLLSISFSTLFGFFCILSILKKFSLSSLLKCLTILLVIFSFFQPWWQFTGSSEMPPAEKTIAMYVNPPSMIEITKYNEETSLNIAEMPDIFITFLNAMIPLAALACISLALGIMLKRLQKKNYALLMNLCAVILLVILLPSYFFGTAKLAETSIGSVQGTEILPIQIGSQTVTMDCSWGFSTGFYLVLIAIIVVIITVTFDVKKRIRQKKKL
jgi:hypothetical protein